MKKGVLSRVKQMKKSEIQFMKWIFPPKMRWKTNQDFEYFALMYSISIRFTHYASLE